MKGTNSFKFQLNYPMIIFKRINKQIEINLLFCKWKNLACVRILILFMLTYVD